MTTVGTIELLAKIDTSAYKKGEKEIEQANSNMEKSGSKTSSGLSSGFSKVAKVGLAALAAATVAVSALIVKNFGNAIKRIDTLNNSSRTFENMGFATKTVSSSMKALEKSITGLPTPLDSAVRGMTSLSATYGDVQLGQKVFTSLNNAILGFGGSAAEVDNAIQQLSQLPMDGPLDAQTWNSLRNSGLTPVLVAMSKDMGISINEMKEKFGEGELTVKDFTDSLIKMNKDGGGGMKSLEKIAKDATSGIGTGWANMQTAITKGIGTIIESIGSKKIATAMGSIGETFKTVLTEISKAITYLKPDLIKLGESFSLLWQNSIQPLLPVLGVLLVGSIKLAANAMTILIPIIDSMSPVIIGAIGALLTFKAALSISGLITAVTTAVQGLSTALVILSAHPIIAVISIMAGLLIALSTMTTSTNILKDANNRLKDSYKAAQDAMQNLKDAQLREKETSLVVERAEKTLADAVKQYGKNSLEAREASLQLDRAKNESKKATNEATEANKNLKKSQDAVAKNEEAVKRIEKLDNSFSNFSGTIGSADHKLGEFNKSLFNLPSSKTIKVSADFVGPLLPNQTRKVGKNAKGTDNWRGGLTWVGEEGPELLDLPRGSKIIPNNESTAIASGAGSITSTSNINITINPEGIIARSRSDLRDIAKDLVRSINEELQAKQQPVIGGGNI